MLTTIARIFGKSPFNPLQSHMKKVSSCMKKLTEIFGNLKNTSPEELECLVKELSNLEHEADLTKNDIRNHLPRSLFLPIDRSQFLDILSIQDSISDKAEDIGHLLTLYPVSELGDLCDHLDQLFKKNMEAFWDARSIIKELHELLESSFGGIEAEKVKTIVEKTSKVEYEADKMKHELMKEFFKTAENVKTPVFYLYVRLVEEINRISHISEKLANRIRMILELK
ncbi:MAG: TIGR00153 family protein [Chlamydiales bacterium]|nr:TIGR00153 family protein [Chlamydiia bacterium]MCP5505005.1 TIGR00153 family protein [Chlamydiales bacterium]